MRPLLLRLQLGLLYFPSARYFFYLEQEGGFLFFGSNGQKNLSSTDKNPLLQTKIPPPQKKNEVGGAPRGEAPDIDSRVGGGANFAASCVVLKELVGFADRIRRCSPKPPSRLLVVKPRS